MRNCPRFVLSCFVSLLVVVHHASFLTADQILMKNGDEVQGDILYQDTELVRIDTLMGELEIKKSRIRKIVFARDDENSNRDIVNVTLHDGSFYRGILIKESKEYIMLEVGQAKKNIAREMIANIDRRDQFILQERPSAEYPLWPTVLKSTILPSWGQFSMNKKTKGSVFAIGTGLFLGGALYTHVSYRAARAEYMNSLTSTGFDQTLYDRANRWRIWNNIFAYATFISWGINILDAAIFRKRETAPSSGKTLGLYPWQSGDAQGIMVRLRF